MDIKPLQAAILTWYATQLRQLPWRGEQDPYKIWISEVMLQQTQVTTVMPYYERFLTRFPSLESLAAASLDEVLKYWEGLGYYARARNLHRAAQQVVRDYGGQLPATAEALRRLPGFGEYTAGAVASIAFGEAVPAIDGNVKRVISRLFAIDADITRKAGRQALEAHATSLAQTAPDPGTWTQALMELGATLCTPTRPKCLLCPAGQGLCQAQISGLSESLPRKPQRKKTPHYDVAAGVIYEDAGQTRFLIARRPLDGLLGGLWEFPGGKLEAAESLPQCLEREIREELGISIAVHEKLATVKHAFTHFRITLHAFAATWTGGQPQALGVADWAWVLLEDLDHYAFGRADQQVIAALRQQGNPETEKSEVDNP